MHKRTFGIFLFLLILVIGIFHNIAIAYYVYWRFLWTDLVVHFLAGLWIALVGFWIFRFWTKEPVLSQRNILIVTLIFAVFVGVFWEIFEYAIGIVEYSSRYTEDTILDILMDVLGGAAGFALVLFYEKNLDKQQIEYES